MFTWPRQCQYLKVSVSNELRRSRGRGSPETSLVGAKKLGTVLKRPLQNAYLPLNGSGAEGLSPIFLAPEFSPDLLNQRIQAIDFPLVGAFVD
jgi:hypothetical protein